MTIDHTAMTDCVKDFDELTAHQIQMAQKVVASFSEDAQDCTELLEMLGIFPNKEDIKMNMVAPLVKPHNWSM